MRGPTRNPRCGSMPAPEPRLQDGQDAVPQLASKCSARTVAEAQQLLARACLLSALVTMVRAWPRAPAAWTASCTSCTRRHRLREPQPQVSDCNQQPGPSCKQAVAAELVRSKAGSPCLPTRPGTGVQHSNTATPSTASAPERLPSTLTCPNDPERPPCREFASKGSGFNTAVELSRC